MTKRATTKGAANKTRPAKVSAAKKTAKSAPRAATKKTRPARAVSAAKKAAKSAPRAPTKKTRPARAVSAAKKAAKSAPSAATKSTMSTMAGAEARADEALVERTLTRMREHDRATADSARAIGEQILEDYFGGDEALVRSKSPTKPASFARLAERAEIETTWDEADLRRAVSMALVYRSLSASVRARVPPTYLERLASIADLTVRRELAARIASGELRGTRAKDAIAGAGRSERAGGPRAMPSAMRFAHRVEAMIQRAADEGEIDADDIAELTDTARRELARRLDASASQLRTMADRLRAS